MTLPVTIPNTFANATTSIPLANLDANFVTIYDTVNGIGNGAESLANVSITGGTVANAAVSNTSVSATTLNTSGAVVFNDAGADVDFRVESDGSTHMLFVDGGNNRVGIGTSSPGVPLDVTGVDGIRVYSNSTYSQKIDITYDLANTSGNQTIFQIITDQNNAYISTVSNKPMLLRTNNTERVRITTDATPYLRLASGTGGIQFNGDTAAANALDDYEEGTFTPQFADAATGGNVATPGTVTGRYVKVGKLLSIQIELNNINTTGLTGANTAFVRNLPFTTATPIVFSFGVQVTGVTFSGYVSGFVNAGTVQGGQNYFRLFESPSGTSHAALTVSDFTSGSASIFTSFTYETA